VIKTVAIVVFLGSAMVVSSTERGISEVPKQDQAARAAAGCGPSNVEFDVKTDNKQHPMSKPEPGKALVYFLHVESQDGGVIDKGWVTTRVGLDGAWAGADQGKSYFFLSVAPGKHAVCTDWQSSIKLYSSQSAAMNLSAEAGKVYYVRTTVKEITEKQKTPGIKIELIDSAQGQLLISSSALSTAQPKK
jgi:Protein of unknown function (DUF2846)